MDEKHGSLVSRASPLWNQALERYRMELNENDDYQAIVEEGFEGGAFDQPDAFEALLPKDRRAIQSLNRLTPVLKAVDDFSAAIAVYFGADARLAAFVWGSIRLILTLASSAGETMREVIDMLEELSFTLPRFKAYEKTFTNDPAFDQALIGVYTEVICFYARTIHFFRSRPHVSLRRRAWGDIHGDFHKTIHRIKRLSATVEKEADRARMRADEAKYNSVLQVMENIDLNKSKEIVNAKYWHMPRGANRHFTDQEDTLQLLGSKLDPGSGLGTLRVFTLYGLGGVGKSEIAIQYALRKRAKFAAVLWISADTTISIGQGFGDVASTLGLSSAEEGIQDSAKAIVKVKQWLQETDLSWLLIFDNADEPSLLKHAWPTNASGSILVTSRDPGITLTVGSAGLQIQSMAESSAVELLLSVIGGTSSDPTTYDQARYITEYFGRLPLALLQIAAFISKRRIPLHNFLAYYQRNASKIDTRKSGFSDYEHTISSVWDLALNSLDGNPSSLIKVLAVLEPDSIDEEVLQGGSGFITRRGFEFLADEMDLGDSEEELLRLSLIDKHTDSGIISMHRLVQTAVLRRMSDDERMKYCTAVIQMLVWGFPEHHSEDQGHQVKTWTRCEKCIGHAFHIGKVIEAYKVKLNDPMTYSELLLRCSWYLYEREMYDIARQLTEQALSLMTDKSSKQYLNAADLLGLIDLDMVRPRAALSVFQQVLATRLAAVPKDDAWVAFSLNNIGIAYTELAELDKAYSAHQEAISIRLRLNSDRIGNSYSNMSSLLLRMARADQAEELLKRCPCLKDFTDETFIKTGNPRFSGDMVLLSRIRSQQGRNDEALRLASKALAFRQKLLGSRLKTCDSLFDVASLLHLDGKTAVAIDLLTELITSAESLPEGQGQLARAHYKLSIIYSGLERTTEMKQHRAKALELRQELQPDQADVAFEETSFNKLCLWMLW